MIVLVNPHSTRSANRRFPLSVMSIGAVLPPDVSWTIVDGNKPDCDPLEVISTMIAERADTRDPVDVVALTVMPGPQIASAIPLSRRLKERHPTVPIVWGGNFPSLYPGPVINAPYIDWAVRGQGEYTFLQLLDVLDGSLDPKTVPGLSFNDNGRPWVGPERTWIGPQELPPPPYHKIDVADYLRPSHLGHRSGVYQASIGCPYSCNFCGVIAVYGSREKTEQPERTVRHLSHLVTTYGMDSVHFYDSNFFLKEDHAVELAERLIPLGIKWWCEARVDAMLRFSDRTWRALRRSGLDMVFFGAESGSNEVLRKMSKRLTTEQILEVARRAREHRIIPEFSFVLGDPDEPALQLETTLAFIRLLKDVNPSCEIITYFFTPTPQRRGTYGNVDPLSTTPATLEEWLTPEWMGWMTHEDVHVPWLTPKMKRRVEDFRLVLKSRFPSVHDGRTRAWGKTVTRYLAARRRRKQQYVNPKLLRTVRRWARIPREDLQAYGHLRPGSAT